MDPRTKSIDQLDRTDLKSRDESGNPGAKKILQTVHCCNYRQGLGL